MVEMPHDVAMSNAERRFWTDVLEQLNPDWAIGMGQDGVLGAAPLASQDTYLYLVDTSSMWISAACTKYSELLRIRRELARSKLATGAASGAANAAVSECAQRRLSADHPDARLAFTAAACAMTEAALWDAVMDRTGSPVGHWTWITYRLNNAEILGRPLFGHTGRPGFMPMEVLMNSLGSALANDIGNPASQVARMIRAGGGVTFCQAMHEAFPQILGGLDGEASGRDSTRRRSERS